MFALACAAGSFALVLLFAARRLFIGPEEGVWLTLVALLCFLISATMVGVGLIGEYVGRTYQAVRRRPRYHVRETLEASPLFAEGGSARLAGSRALLAAVEVRRTEGDA
jgi:undecaprenyl-phosphate 4-deoxy-4-formamido-L-arabinose transferase